jgi:hypothetical protein
MNAKPAVSVRKKPVPQQPPWFTEAQAVRERAREEGKPCVLLLNADSSAL